MSIQRSSRCVGPRQAATALLLGLAAFATTAAAQTPATAAANKQASIPSSPLTAAGKPVDWWFVFKFNASAFPACPKAEVRSCPFGIQPQDYSFYGLQYVSATNIEPALKMGDGCLGETDEDPVGATFKQLYAGDYYYVVWNDQFYSDPVIAGCGDNCGAPWGHSKGAVAWDDSGQGFVLQVTTPSWPASGSVNHPRKTDGNTLGCVKDPDVVFSQDFFSLRLTKDDLAQVLTALATASVVTDVSNPQIVHNGGPADIQALVSVLGHKSTTKAFFKVQLSTGVGLLAKPSALHVPPWQFVSAELGGVPLRVASWWLKPAIDSTSDTSAITCWDDSLGHPGPVEIATSGSWMSIPFGLKGGPSPNSNHAKIGVSTGGDHHFVIFGDMNQQGTLSGDNCGSSQNGRGGLFFILDNEGLAAGVSQLIKGDSDPILTGTAH